MGELKNFLDHQPLIQAMLSRGPLKEDEFCSIFSKLTASKSSGSQKQQEQQKQQLFNDYLRRINVELSYVQLELRACHKQYDGNVHYGVVKNVADDQSKLGTKYTVPYIAFCKGIICAEFGDTLDTDAVLKFVDSDQDVILAADLIRMFSPGLDAHFDNENVNLDTRESCRGSK